MSTKTTNLELTKPAYGESADIAVINANMDTLDTAVAGKVTAPSGTVTANTAVVFDGTTGKAVKSSGKTLGTACSKDFTTAVTSGSANLVTSGGVYSALNWKVLWSNNAGINDKNTYSLSQDPTTFHELMIIARSDSTSIGFSSKVISTIGLTPSNTYLRNSWDSWNACSFPTEDGNSNTYAITIQFMPLKTFKIAYYWHSKLFAILAR